jgi:hypothetical protein
VFIVGMPRSGTTLVEQILASHTKVFGAGELATMGGLLGLFFAHAPGRNSGDSKGPITQLDIDIIRSTYLETLSAMNVSEKTITDKMPMNFLWIGFILSAFPEAKIIRLNRDPMATCWSIYRRFFSSKGNDYGYDMVDLAQFYELYTDLMSFWHEHFPNRIFDICYEDLTANQEDETRKLLDYCELDWQENCLSFHKTKRVVKTASAAQVRQEMYKGSSEVWKKYESYLRPMIESLDYRVSR